VSGRPRTQKERDWRAANQALAAHIAAVVDAAPPLTPEQTARLRMLLTPVLRPEPEGKS
jgi:hypothetical protein